MIAQNKKNVPHNKMGFPKHGEASTYSDFFQGKTTYNGDTYNHEKYTAALLPKSRWHALHMGTLLKLTYHGRKVVVKVNDRGAGKIVDGHADGSRVLDLSRAAYAYLIGKKVTEVTDDNAGVIQLDDIKIVPPTTRLGRCIEPEKPITPVRSK